MNSSTTDNVSSSHPLQQKASAMFFYLFILTCTATKNERLCHTCGRFIVYGEMLKDGNSGSAASKPPTGALCVKSVGFSKLFSHTRKGDSINHISQKSPAAPRKAAETQRWRMRGRETERVEGRRQRSKGHGECDDNVKMRQGERESNTL